MKKANENVRHADQKYKLFLPYLGRFTKYKASNKAGREINNKLIDL
jgi:hypothetical protein